MDNKKVKYCKDCHFFSLPFCVRKSSGILMGNRIKYDVPEYVADTFYCHHFKELISVA